MPIPLIERFFNLVRTSTFIGEKLKFYLNNPEMMEWYQQKKFKIPCVKSDYIFGEIKYQEVVRGSNIGILKQYTIKELETIKPNPDEIIILNGTPDILPNVRGIIVNELQTPLSHLVLFRKKQKDSNNGLYRYRKRPQYQKLLSKK